MVRVVVENEQTRSYGSGTWVCDEADRRFILTCAHLFDKGNPVRVSVYFPDSFSFDVQLLAIDRIWDLAILNPERPQDRPAVSVAENYARPGDPICFGGYGKTGQYRQVCGRVVGYCQVSGTETKETMLVTGEARQGDSGGPMFDQNGRLAGVLWGTDGQNVCGTYQGRIRRFMESSFPPPFWPGKQNSGDPETSSRRANPDELVEKIRQMLESFKERNTSGCPVQQQVKKTVSDWIFSMAWSVTKVILVLLCLFLLPVVAGIAVVYKKYHSSRENQENANS